MHPQRIPAPRVWQVVLANILLCIGLQGCGDSSAQLAPSPGTQDATREALRTRLYAHSSAELQAWPTLAEAPADIRAAATSASTLIDALQPVEVGAFAVRYLPTNLPQVTLHFKRATNRKLLVYNHGHGGLPQATDTFALEFLRAAFDAGHDLLITSMPLTGLNAPLPTSTYAIRTRGHADPAPVDRSILTTFFSMHALYEVIDDPDHYMHYFIDGAVMPASVLASGLYAAEQTPYLSNRPAVAPMAYTEVNFVGLSGGATTGLTACAVHRFDRCILVAGVMPDHLRVKYVGNFGDAEQQTRSLHEQFSTPALIGIATRTSRKMVLLYNHGDTCCFANPSATEFQQQYPTVDIRISSLAFHGYESGTLLGILAE